MTPHNLGKSVGQLTSSMANSSRSALAATFKNRRKTDLTSKPPPIPPISARLQALEDMKYSEEENTNSASTAPEEPNDDDIPSFPPEDEEDLRHSTESFETGTYTSEQLKIMEVVPPSRAPQSIPRFQGNPMAPVQAKPISSQQLSQSASRGTIAPAQASVPGLLKGSVALPRKPAPAPMNPLSGASTKNSIVVDSRRPRSDPRVPPSYGADAVPLPSRKAGIAPSGAKPAPQVRAPGGKVIITPNMKREVADDE